MQLMFERADKDVIYSIFNVYSSIYQVDTAKYIIDLVVYRFKQEGLEAYRALGRLAGAKTKEPVAWVGLFCIKMTGRY